MVNRHPKRRGRVRRVLLLVLVALLGYGVGIAQPYVVRAPLVPGQDAMSTAASREAVVTVEDVGGRVLSIRPTTEPRLLLILYPGGLVRPQAYEWLGRALADEGVHTVIPEFPVDLAVLGASRAEELIAEVGHGRPVVLAGHSLGGAMAASYAADHPDDVDGLVLLAAYPSTSTSLVDAHFPALSLLAEHDEVAAEADVRDGLTRLPADTELVVVPGAVHSFFGRYGPQSGDGQPTVSRAEAEGAIVDAIEAFLEGIA